MKRKAILILGAIVVFFGLGCLNYTRRDGWEHHREFAQRNNLPEPSTTIFFLGVASVAVGSGAVGFAIGFGRGINGRPRLVDPLRVFSGDEIQKRLWH
jgi:hypothetical protein